MNISYGVPVMAPQTTGHPAGLPADPSASPNAARVAPVEEKSDSAGAGLRKQDDEQSAPPSAIQRKIMELLERQAKELDQG